MRRANVLPIAVMAFALVGFLFVLDYSISGGKWPWSSESERTNTKSVSNINVTVNTNSETNINTASNTNTATNVTADLKTYTSDKYGFSFNYPKAWDKQTVGCGALPCKESSGFTPNGLLQAFKAKYGNDSFWLTTLGVDTSDLNPKSWFDKNISPPTPVETNQTPINSNPAYFAKIVTDSYTDREYVISHSGIIVHFQMREISIHYSPQGVIDDKQTYSQYVSEFDAIVHSLIFSPIADWKTYANTQLGFSFSYPKNLRIVEGTGSYGGYIPLGLAFFEGNTSQGYWFEMGTAATGQTSILKTFEKTYGFDDLSTVVTPMSDVTIGSKVAKQYCGIPGNVSYCVAMFVNNGSLFTFNYREPSTLPNNILSTFTFTK